MFGVYETELSVIKIAASTDVSRHCSTVVDIITASYVGSNVLPTVDNAREHFVLITFVMHCISLMQKLRCHGASAVCLGSGMERTPPKR